MLRTIRLKNFKCFLDQSFELSNLNVLCGLNGSGKSTLIQAFLLLKQSESIIAGSIRRILLDGKYYDFGTARDILNNFSDEDRVSILLNSADVSYTINMLYSSHENLFRIEKNLTNNGYMQVLERMPRFTLKYVAADRSGPKTTYRRYNSEFRNTIDPAGNYVVPFISDNLDLRVKDEIQHEAGNSNSLIDQIRGWISEVSPGTDIVVDTLRDLSISTIRFANKAGMFSTEWHRPTNVGFGVSYILPVIVSLLTARENDLLIIENPEAHIHPRGQAALGRLICMVANTGPQIVIETHSDHIINSIRIAVKNQVLSKESVKISYFEKKTLENSIVSEVTEVKIDKDGRITNWPKGFFDEWDNALIELL